MALALCAALVSAAAPLLTAVNPPAAETESARFAWISQARANINNCENSVAFLTILGRMLLRSGEFEEAADHLERAVMIGPDDRSARIAYAHALERLGDTSGARQLLSTTAASVNLQTAASQLRTATQPYGRRQELSWRIQSGVETNPLGASTLNNLTLTLPGLDPGQPVLITLPIDRKPVPRAVAHLQGQGTGRWGIQARSPVNSQGITWQSATSIVVSLQGRVVPELSEAGFHLGDLTIEHQTMVEPFRGAGWALGPYVTTGYTGLNSQTGVRFRQRASTWGAAVATAQCLTRLGHIHQQRQYPVNIRLDGTLRGWAGQWSCAGWPMVALKRTTDLPEDPNRPGGITQGLEWRLSGAAGAWTYEWERTRNRDEQGFSPLLSQGVRREINRNVIKIEYRAAVPTRFNPRKEPLAWSVGIEVQRQLSNLELFKTNNLGVFFTVTPAK